MKIINPVTILPTMMTDNNVAITETPWVAGSYALAAVVSKDNHVWQSLAAANTATPGAETVTPLKWLDMGAVNRWAMFDKSAKQVIEDSSSQRSVYLIGTKTTNLNKITFKITPGMVVNSLALFGIVGYQVTVTVTDPIDGIITNRVISLIDANVNNMWEWLFKPIGKKGNLTIIDLPSYGSSSITITIDAATGTNAECVMCSIGQLDQLGISCFGTTISLTDYSVRKVDDFGNESLIERGFRDRVQYDVKIETGDVYRVKNVLASLRAKGVVYIGDENRQETIQFGRYRDLQVVLDNWSISECALDVGSLI